MNRLRTRLILWIWGSTALLFLVVQVTGFVASRRHALAELRQEGLLLVTLHSSQLDAAVLDARSVAEALALSMLAEGGELRPPADYEPRMRGLLKSHPRLSALAVWVGGGGVELRRGPGDQFQIRPPRGGRPPDPSDPAWKTTESGKPATWLPLAIPGGTVAAELELETVLQPVNEWKGDAAYAFLTGPQDHLLLVPGQGSVTDLNAEVRARFRKREPALFQSLDPVWGKPAWIAFAPAEESEWGVGLVYLLEDHVNAVFEMEMESEGLAVLGLLGLLVLVTLLSNRIARPIVELSHSARQVAGGSLDHKVTPPVNSTLEVTDLAHSFNAMIDDLRDYIEQLKTTTAEQERISSELAIAGRIQRSILPDRLPDHPLVCIHAVTEPARQVGGDFYDYFWLSPERLGFLLGDVSGKGVPAAIYMASCSSLMRTLSLSEPSLARCLATVNQVLCGRGEPTMFVTLFYGVLDLSTAVLEYVNAGHHPPLVLREGGMTPLEGAPELALGIYPGEYTQKSSALKPGDRLVLYTDGVTEAMNEAREEFGEEGLRSALQRAMRDDLPALLARVMEAVDRFAAEKSAMDDTTMLVLEYRNQPGAPGTTGAPGTAVNQSRRNEASDSSEDSSASPCAGCPPVRSSGPSPGACRPGARHR